MAASRRRSNLAERSAESWRPAPLEPPHTELERWVFAARRFFDLQAGSIWNDVTDIAGSVHGKVVDVGCGAQPYRDLFGSQISYLGLDTTEAEARFGYRKPDTLYFSGEVWPDQALEADFVLCTETLEHVLDPLGFLKQAHRCLKPGGRLLLTVPFSARWHFVPYDYWRFTPSGLKHLLESAGFKNISVWGRGNALTVACYKAMSLCIPLLFPQTQNKWAAFTRRVAGAPTSPLFVGFAVIANLSLRGQGGDDCIGYTALAERG